MWPFKSDPKESLQKEFNKKLQEAMEAQRNGNIELYSRLTEESENLLKKIEDLEQKPN